MQAVGHNFTKNATFTAATSYQELRRFLELAQAQDVEVWDYTRHIRNETYLQSLAGKLVVVGMAGLQTEYLAADFLSDFRKFQQEHRYSLNKYAFALLDLDDEPMFNYLTTFSLGRFDSPGVFALRGEELQGKLVYYRNYLTYG